MVSDPHTFDSRALIYLKTGQFATAIADYEAALKADPKLAVSLYGRGIAKQKKGDGAGAEADLKAATAIESNVGEAFARYGVR